MSIRRPAILLAGALLALPPAQPHAQPSGRHGDGHAQHHDWYKDLRQPDTGSRCCNGSTDGQVGDCRPAPSYMGEDGFWRVWDGRDWLVVPRSKIITMPTPDRGTHLCELYGKVFCFITSGPSS
jgi:hypothetical protein